MEAGLAVLGVVDLPYAPVHWMALGNRLHAERKAERLKKDLRCAAEAWHAAGVPTEHRVSIGTPEEEVRRVARHEGPFLAVVVGELGSGPGGRVTEKIVGRLHREIDYPVVTLAGRRPEKALAYARLGAEAPTAQRPQRPPRPVGKLIAFGVLSLLLYGLAFWNQDRLLGVMSLGSWYAVLPIVTVFFFSFVHGAFANYVWKALGIRAKRRG
jgi:hypothetical protein